LGFMEVAHSLHPDQSGLSQPPPTLPPLSQDTQQTQLVNNDNAGTSLSSVLAKEPTEHPFPASLSPETIANHYPSRRSVLQTFGVVGAGIIAAPHVLVKHHPPDVSAASVANLATITQQYRAMQRRGDTFIRHGLNVHLTTLQDALERAINETIRRELWRVLAQTQLLARLNWHSTKKLELAQVKALNEAAIISAQNSGDRVLVGAALGHLAHLYLSEAQDTQSASQLLDRAREHVQHHHALNGWFDIVTAAIAAKEGNRQECEAAIADAMHAAYSMPQTPESADPYFTDFSLTSVEAFAGNCWLSVEEPEQAYSC